MHFIFVPASFFILFRYAFSIPFEGDSENINLFDITSAGSDLQDYSNTLTLNPTDLFSSSSSSSPSLFSTNNNNDGFDNNIDDNNLDIFLSEAQFDSSSNNYCPLGKRQNADGGVCDSSIIPSPPIQLQFPDLNDLINIGSQEEEATPAKTQTEGENPCALVPGYPQHACCNGPLGAWDKDEYFTVDDCDPSAHTLLLPPPPPPPPPPSTLFYFYSLPKKSKSLHHPHRSFSPIHLRPFFSLFPLCPFHSKIKELFFFQKKK